MTPVELTYRSHLTGEERAQIRAALNPYLPIFMWSAEILFTAADRVRDAVLDWDFRRASYYSEVSGRMQNTIAAACVCAFIWATANCEGEL